MAKTVSDNLLKVIGKNGTYESIIGLRGESAYDIAVRNGYTGTENDFLLEFVPDDVVQNLIALTTRVNKLEGYTLAIPKASTSELGGVKVGSGLSIDSNGTLSANGYNLPKATSSTLGGVKVGTGLSVDNNGVLSSDVEQYELPKASTSSLGGVKVGSRLTIDSDGVLSADNQSYDLPNASASTLGGVKVGNRLSIDANGVLSANDQSYTLPTASANEKGGIKVGSGLSIDGNGVLSANEPTIPTATASTIGGIKIGEGLTILNGVLSIDTTKYMPIQNNAGYHNSVYRGKDLTNVYTIDEIYNRIDSGTFEDLFIGDYFTVTINTSLGGEEEVECILADFDTFYDTQHFGYNGDFYVRRHHAVIVPRDCFKEKARFHSSTSIDDIFNSYPYKPELIKTTLPIYETAIKSAFNNKVMAHYCRNMTSFDANIASSAGAGLLGSLTKCNYSTTILELMNAYNVFGTSEISSSYLDGYGNDKQFNLFRHNPGEIASGHGWNDSHTYRKLGFYWLSTIVSSNKAGCVDEHGAMGAVYDITRTGYIRPYWVMGNNYMSY